MKDRRKDSTVWVCWGLFGAILWIDDNDLVDSRMVPVALTLILTPHGHLTLTESSDAPPLDAPIAQRLYSAFERGSGHGLLHLGAAEAGTVLPAVFSYWREFGAQYVTSLCSQPDAHVAPPDDLDLERLVFAAPPMTGAEYLTAAVLQALWRELDAAFAIELAESNV